MKGLKSKSQCYIYKTLSKLEKGGKVCVSENKLKDKECLNCKFKEDKNVK